VGIEVVHGNFAGKMVVSMPYLIDGHNLIPKIRGMSLREMDDEEQLIGLLQAFQRVRRTKVEVFFDKAPAGQARTKSYGNVIAHFVRQGLAADEAIIQRLRRLGNDARNWSVVSSDRHVQAEANALHAQVISSDDFSLRLEEALRQAPPVSASNEGKLGESEVEEWLKLFKSRKP
jgi:predicted RNA-binding protein with PIN domain